MALEVNNSYLLILQELKEKIRQSRIRAVVALNNELLQLYWEIGDAVNSQQKVQQWGSKVIERLVADLKLEFEDMKGLSPRNLRYMRDFAKAYPSFPIWQQSVAKLENVDNELLVILQQAVAKLPWGHNCVLLDKAGSVEKRTFYATKAVENGWTRDMLLNQIENRLYETQKLATTDSALSNNFSKALPAYDSELALQLFRDPYNLDFIRMTEKAKEKDLEDALMQNVIKLLLTLGDGFALMDRQKRFTLGNKEFIIDLLFYHTRLRRHVVVELKIGDFKAEYVSKMNLYLGIVDDQLRGEFDEPSIGLILCKTKDKVVAEYALRDTNKPIGIAEYKLGKALPEDIKEELPTIKQIEERIDEELKNQSSSIEDRLKAIKNKLNNLHTEAIQKPVAPAVLSRIYKKGLLPLYKQLIRRLSEFSGEFHELSYKWWALDKNADSYKALEELWKENVLTTPRSIHELHFTYFLRGLKKAGTDNFSTSVDLVFVIDEYWYGFKILNYNNHQPFLKKLYHQNLEDSEINEVADQALNYVIDSIEYFIKNTQS
jgi:predicted nuclease of restriction endonuclease-like (RecB) superfamily